MRNIINLNAGWTFVKDTTDITCREDGADTAVTDFSH